MNYGCIHRPTDIVAVNGGFTDLLSCTVQLTEAYNRTLGMPHGHEPQVQIVWMGDYYCFIGLYVTTQRSIQLQNQRKSNRSKTLTGRFTVGGTDELQRNFPAQKNLVFDGGNGVIVHQNQCPLHLLIFNFDSFPPVNVSHGGGSGAS